METPPEAPRPPDEDDLFSLCRALNRREARYIVVGGMAVIQHGHLRATEDMRGRPTGRALRPRTLSERATRRGPPPARGPLPASG
jgi:hypothetical protein